VKHLLRRLELGLLLVRPKARTRKVEIALDPAPFKRRRSHVNRRAVLHEINGRSGDYNAAGSTRKKLMTAYRENAIFIACCLEKHGPLSPRQLRCLGTGPKTTAILYDNVYGWFDHIDKGLYGLNKKAPKALEEFNDVTEQYRKSVEELPQP